MKSRRIESEADRVLTQERPQPPQVTGFARHDDEHEPACFIRLSEPAARGTSQDRVMNRLEQQRDTTQSVEDRAGRQVESAMLPHRQPTLDRQVRVVLREQQIDEHRVAQIASGNEFGGQLGSGDNWLRRHLLLRSLGTGGLLRFGSEQPRLELLDLTAKLSDGAVLLGDLDRKSVV